MVEVTVSEDHGKRSLVQLVNNSGAFGLTFFEPLPVENIRLEIPSERSPVSVVSLMGVSVKWRQEEKTLHLWLERLGEYDALEVVY